MQAIKKKNKKVNGHGQKVAEPTLDMQHNQNQPNTSWNIRKLAHLASLNLCSAIFKPKEAMHKQLQLKFLNTNMVILKVNLWLERKPRTTQG